MMKYVTVDVQLGSLLWQALHFLHRVGKLKEVLIFNDYWQSLDMDLSMFVNVNQFQHFQKTRFHPIIR